MSRPKELPKCPIEHCSTGKVDLLALNDILQELNAKENVGASDGGTAGSVEARKPRYHPVSGTLMMPGDKTGTLYISAAEDHIRSTDTYQRYAAFAGYGMALARDLAYVSPVSDSFRSYFHPGAVQRMHLFSWAYMAVDVGKEMYAASETYGLEGDDLWNLGLQRTAFHLSASVAVPMFAVSAAAQWSGFFFSKLGRFQNHGPSLVGLAVLPLLPALVDEPLEHLVSEAFETFWPPHQKVIHSTLEFHE